MLDKKHVIKKKSRVNVRGALLLICLICNWIQEKYINYAGIIISACKIGKRSCSSINAFLNPRSYS